MLTEFHESVQLSSGEILSSEHFKLNRPGKSDIRAEINFLNGMLYIWVGLVSMHPLNNLQIAYPGQVQVKSCEAVCKLILGEDSLESSNQVLAKRISQKLGRPVMLSFNYESNEFDGNDRLEIFQWLMSILEEK